MEKSPAEVSWFEPLPRTSLALINQAQMRSDAAILDVGGGASRLAGELLLLGYTDVSVADLSGAALSQAVLELGNKAEQIAWIEADVRAHDFGRRYDLWHDRAVFHFMVDPADRAGYLQTLERTLLPGGRLIIGTFGGEGPNQCSGLPVHRYTPGQLTRVLGKDYKLVSSRHESHRTPAGNQQQFLYAHFVRSEGRDSPASTQERADRPVATTVDELLARARAKLTRLSPAQAHAATSRGAVLVDIRPQDQRERDGALPGARVIPRNVLEWRLDPQSAHGDPEAARTDRPVIVICDEGYQSSLAAATLREFGLDATDVIGGVQAWRTEGQPVDLTRPY